jgi:hypothetical protein
MNQHFQPRNAKGGYPRQRPARQRPSEESPEEQDLPVDQYAGVVARGIIKQAGIEDSTEIWRALKRAYMAGYADATEGLARQRSAKRPHLPRPRAYRRLAR